MIDVTDSFIEPRLKDGRPKLSRKSTPKANARRDVVVCVGGMWDGRTWPRHMFALTGGLASIRQNFAPLGELRPTPRFVDGPKERGHVTRVPAGFEDVRTHTEATHFARHLYRLNDVDDRAYWHGLDEALVLEVSSAHADRKANKGAA